MSIYGLYAAADGKSYLTELEIAGNGPALNAPLPCSGWRPFQCDPGVTQGFHPTPVAGMTVVLDGCMEISVGGGTLRHVALRRGDMLLVLDTQGEGHATALTGTDRFRVTGVTIRPSDWPAVQAAFTGWPDNLLPP